jgi:hypothetical protein
VILWAVAHLAAEKWRPLELGYLVKKGVLVSLTESKTGVLYSRPKLLGFDMPCMAT